jgi:hypothetical protein
MNKIPTVCHLRGEKDYWNKKCFHSTVSEEFDVFFKNIVTDWDNFLNISYFDFRKRIRDVVISRLTSIFDIVLLDDEECKEFLTKNQNIIFFQQDDDDIFLELPKTKSGLNIFEYFHIDANTLRREAQYNKRKNFKNNKLRKIQSNHIIINNKNTAIDLNLYEMWNAGHTTYDNIIPSCSKRHIHFHISSFSIHFYHLCSLSALYSVFKKNKYNLLSSDEFIILVKQYINSLNTFSINVPLIVDFKKIYNKLLV